MASVKMPTAAELAKVGTELGMNLSDSDIAFFQETFAGNVAAYNLLETLPDNLPAVKYPAHAGLSARGRREQVQSLVPSRARSRARPRASSRARGWRSRTMSASPACR